MRKENSDKLYMYQKLTDTNNTQSQKQITNNKILQHKSLYVVFALLILLVCVQDLILERYWMAKILKEKLFNFMNYWFFEVFRSIQSQKMTQ